jgi:glycosyltransferase involved in cell wall biosynthesis
VAVEKKSVYAGVFLQDGSFSITLVSKNKKVVLCEKVKKTNNTVEPLLSWFTQYSIHKNRKIIAVGIVGAGWESLYNRIWLELDAVPVRVSVKGKNAEALSKKAAHLARDNFDKDDSHKVQLDGYGRVGVQSLVKLADYEKITPPDEFRFLINEARKFKGKRLLFISATPQGGGVAIMRHGMMRLLRLLEVRADWLVLKDDERAFYITKILFHNVLQGVALKGVSLSRDDKAYYNHWCAQNAKRIGDVFPEYDVIVLDDPQPSGLFSYIKKKNPKSKIIYRSHIELVSRLADREGTSQKVTWDFIWDKLKDCDLFVSHPVQRFIPKNVPRQKVVFAPPCTDPLDGLNKELTEEQKGYYMQVFNRLLFKSGQVPLDPDRAYIAQIARFDPSKGIPDLIHAYKKLIDKYKGSSLAKPQLVVVGNGSIDDPEGVPVLNMTKKMLSVDEFKDIRDDVKLIRLSPHDQLLNTVCRQAKIIVQLSKREGFEFKIAEALIKGKPVIIYNSGGMPVQVNHGKTGFVVNRSDIDGVTEYLFRLMTDARLYNKMSSQARRLPVDVLTPSHTASWLWMANEILSEDFKPNGGYIKTLSGQGKFGLKRFKVLN